jgi:hypothetical protein
MAPDYITSDLVVAPESMEVLDSEIVLENIEAQRNPDNPLLRFHI